MTETILIRLLALLFIALPPAQSAEPPLASLNVRFTEPIKKVEPSPAPNPDAPIMLTGDTLLVVDADVDVLVWAFPAGVVTVTKEAGPLKIRGRFAGGDGKVETRTFKGKCVVSVEAVGTGDVSLLVLPVGATSEQAAVVRRITANQGPKPPPPSPVDPPKPSPDFQPSKLHILIVSESSRQSPQDALIFADLALSKRLVEKGHQWRVVDPDVKDSTGAVPADLKTWLARAKDKTLPYIFVVDPGGKTRFEGPLPGDAQELLKIIQKCGG